MIKILLIDDHELVRAGICQMLKNMEGIQVVGEASTGAKAIDLIRDLNPQVVILDFRLPDITGLEVTTKMLCIDPDLKILVVTSAINDLIPFRLLKAGAKGYLTKDATKDEFMNAIIAVNAGQSFVSPEIAKCLVFSEINLKNNVFFNLSDREIEVMMMVIHGVQIQDIADKLYLTTKAVRDCRDHIFEKLNVKNDVALTLLALRHGLISNGLS